MKEMWKKYCELRSVFHDKMKEVVNKISDGGNKVKLDSGLTKRMKFYSTYEIVEVGVDERVTKEVYIRCASGTLIAFNAINLDMQYNIVSGLCDWYKVD